MEAGFGHIRRSLGNMAKVGNEMLLGAGGKNTVCECLNMHSGQKVRGQRLDMPSLGCDLSGSPFRMHYPNEPLTSYGTCYPFK